MASERRISIIPSYHAVLISWLIVLALTIDTLGQVVKFRPQDEVNDVILFEQEANVRLVCEADDFPDGSVIEIRHEGFGLISGQGLSASISGNFTVEVMGKSTILTIKEVSDLTDGQYTCTVTVSNADPVSAIFDLMMIPRFESPQCYSSKTDPITEGDAFYADCFYATVGTTDAKWVRIGRDGSEIDVGSTEIALEAKFRRRLAIPPILEADDGVSYKCILDRMVGAITVPTSDCTIGPLEVRATTSTVSGKTSHKTTPESSTPSPAEKGRSTSEGSATSEQGGVTKTAATDRKPTDRSLNEPFSLEEYLLYIIIGAVAVVVILFILCGICICCCSRKSGGKRSGDPERGKASSPGVNSPGDYNQIPFQTVQRNGSLFYDKPPSSTREPSNQGYANPKEAEANRYSVIIPGPGDMVSTPL